MHSSEGLRILGFPSHEFMGQEFKDPKKIKAFVDKMGVEFDVFSPIKVNGNERHPLYKYLMQCTTVSNINWNFSTAFVVGRDGSVRTRVDHPQKNNWSQLKEEISSLLEETPSAPSTENTENAGKM